MKNNSVAILLFALLWASCGTPAAPKQEVPKETTVKTDTPPKTPAATERTAAEQLAEADAKTAEIQKAGKALETAIKNGKQPVLFHGMTTEPFYDIYITDKELLVMLIGEDVVVYTPIKNKFDKNLKSQEILYTDSEGKEQKIIIKKEKGSDGMSDTVYPYSVKMDDHEGGGYSHLRK